MVTLCTADPTSHMLELAEKVSPALQGINPKPTTEHALNLVPILPLKVPLQRSDRLQAGQHWP